MLEVGDTLLSKVGKPVKRAGCRDAESDAGPADEVTGGIADACSTVVRLVMGGLFDKTSTIISASLEMLDLPSSIFLASSAGGGGSWYRAVGKDEWDVLAGVLRRPRGSLWSFARSKTEPGSVLVPS